MTLSFSSVSAIGQLIGGRPVVISVVWAHSFVSFRELVYRKRTRVLCVESFSAAADRSGSHHRDVPASGWWVAGATAPAAGMVALEPPTSATGHGQCDR
jgi:hypothetical protein